MSRSDLPSERPAARKKTTPAEERGGKRTAREKAATEKKKDEKAARAREKAQREQSRETPPDEEASRPVHNTRKKAGHSEARARRGGECLSFYDPARRLHKVMPIVLLLLGVAFGACLIGDALSGESGGYLGHWLTVGIGALFGRMTYALPLLLVAHGLFWKQDVRRHMALPRIPLSLLAWVVAAALTEAATAEIPLSEMVLSAEHLIAEGQALRGGGLFGGAAVYGLYHLLGLVCMWILLVALLVVYAASFPDFRRMRARWNEHADDRAAARERRSARREQRTAERAAARAEQDERRAELAEAQNEAAQKQKEEEKARRQAEAEAKAARKEEKQRLREKKADEKMSFATRLHLLRMARQESKRRIERGEGDDLGAIMSRLGDEMEQEDLSGIASVDCITPEAAAPQDTAGQTPVIHPSATASVPPVVSVHTPPRRAAFDDAASAPATAGAKAPVYEPMDEYPPACTVDAPAPTDPHRADAVPQGKGRRVLFDDATAMPAHAAAPRIVDTIPTSQPEPAPQSAPGEEREPAPAATYASIPVEAMPTAKEPPKESANYITEVEVRRATKEVREGTYQEEETETENAPHVVPIRTYEIPKPAKTPEMAQQAAGKSRAYQYPSLELLRPGTNSVVDQEVQDEIARNSERLIDTLDSFHVTTHIVGTSRGPRITRYEIMPDKGVRINSITSRIDDISLNLATAGIRIEAPIPGMAAVGVEVPNRKPTLVRIRDLLSTDEFLNAKSKSTVALGADVTGRPVYADIAKMPHLLIAGATGMGKSVCINAILLSLLYKARPDEVKLILVDPKKVELGIYNNVPHLLVPVVTDPQAAAGSLIWAVGEMERRFELIEQAGVRDLKSYNAWVGQHPEKGQPLPKIIIIIDELNDLMMSARDAVEASICRIAQKARAAGMHLIIGTQRPSVDVITGLIKANIPSRIAFHVTSQVDSRTVLDFVGAEKLLDKGDMLAMLVGLPEAKRIQGSMVEDEEVEKVTTFLKENAAAGGFAYDSDIIDQIQQETEKYKASNNKHGEDDMDEPLDPDELDEFWHESKFRKAVELAVRSGKISTSLIQRRMSLGYGKAAKYIDIMEQMGIVGPPDGQRPREVKIDEATFQEMVARHS